MKRNQIPTDTPVVCITTWGKKPLIPYHTFIGPVDSIFAQANKDRDCNLDCMEKEIRAACMEGKCIQAVEDENHWTIVIRGNRGSSYRTMVAVSQKIANDKWLKVFGYYPDYKVISC